MRSMKKTRRILLVALLMAVCVALLPDELSAFQYDLSESATYVRRGFDRSWVNSLPADDGTWLALSPSPKGLFPLRVRELPLSGLPTRKFLSFKKCADEPFTFVTSFDIPDGKTIREKLLGLFLAQVGINWEVYLNGTLVQSEMHQAPDGTIVSGRNVRLQLVPLNPCLLREGKNVLAFRIVGDPTLPDTGFYRKGPYLVGEYQELEPLTQEIGSLVLLFIYLFLGAYHIFLYFNRRSAVFNLYYGFFTMGLFVYNIVRTRYVYPVVADTDILILLELVVLYTLVPLMGSFLESILWKRMTLFTKIYWGFSAALIAFTLGAPPSTEIDILRIWQATAAVPIFYYLALVVGRTYIANAKQMYAADGAMAGRMWASLGASLVKTVAGNLLIGCIIMAGCAAFDIIDAVFFSSTITLAKFGFFFFNIGIALVLANRFIYIHGKVESLNEDLERNLNDLREANRLIGISEEKYKLLVEGSNDIIFTLDEELNFITMNRAISIHLKYKPAEVLKMNFMDLVHESPSMTSFSKQIVREKLELFLKSREPLSFKVQMKAAYSAEPKEMQVRLEYILVDGKSEITGKAVSILEDSLINSFISESQKYAIGNFINIAEEMSYRMTRNLAAYIDRRDAGLVRIALFEVVLNAIEHGNLAIGFEEKTQAVTQGNYMEFLRERQSDPKSAGKRVKIEYSVNSERVVYIVTDEGAGFDHEAILRDDSDRANREMLSHGRGITMAKNIFDRVKYNERGNQVMLIKYFRKGPAGPS